MAKKVAAVIKLQIPAGKATPAPQVGKPLVNMVLRLWSLQRLLMKRQLVKLG